MTDPRVLSLLVASLLAQGDHAALSCHRPRSNQAGWIVAAVLLISGCGDRVGEEERRAPRPSRMEVPEPYVILNREFHIGEATLSGLEVHLPTRRGENTRFWTFDASDHTREGLEAAVKSWDKLWPELERRLSSGIEAYKTGQTIGGTGFSGTFDFELDPEESMGDESDYLISFSCDIEVPGWDAFIKEDHIVHFQPVF